MSVGTFGTDGAGAVGIPKGFLDPVTCVLTGSAGAGGDGAVNGDVDGISDDRGAEEGRGGGSVDVGEENALNEPDCDEPKGVKLNEGKFDDCCGCCCWGSCTNGNGFVLPVG